VFDWEIAEEFHGWFIGKGNALDGVLLASCPDSPSKLSKLEHIRERKRTRGLAASWLFIGESEASLQPYYGELLNVFCHVWRPGSSGPL
jgi:hypothetical protein